MTNLSPLDYLAILCLFGAIGLLVGIPALWVLIGMFLLIDLGVILHLGHKPRAEPTVRKPATLRPELHLN